MNLAKMSSAKLRIILKRRFFESGPVELVFSRFAQQLGTDKVLVEEELSEADIHEINLSPGVLTRHDIDPKLAEKIKVPILAQHESPLKYTEHVANKKFIYLTDSAYFCLFPRAEPLPQTINSNFRGATTKHYDILFIGNSRNFSGIADTPRVLLAKSQINNFGSIFDIIHSSYARLMMGLVKHLWPRVYYEFAGDLLNDIRAQRRKVILKKLHTLIETGRKVVLVGDQKILNAIPSAKNLHKFENLPWHDIEQLMLESRMTICTTPCHQSTLNERYISAFQNDTIPLYEPYPQYTNISKAADDWFMFDYSKCDLAVKAENILKNYQEARFAYLELRKNIFNRYQEGRLALKYKQILDRHTIDQRNPQNPNSNLRLH